MSTIVCEKENGTEELGFYASNAKGFHSRPMIIAGVN